MAFSASSKHFINSSTRVITDTYAGILARPKTAGFIYYATDQLTYYGYNGTDLTDIGGSSTSPTDFAIQHGDDYNSVDSTLEGTSSIAITDITTDIKAATYTPDGTNFGSLIKFDTVSDPEIKKGEWYGVILNYQITGNTDGLYEIAIYDNGVQLEKATSGVLEATGGENKAYKVVFTMPDSPTDLRLVVTDLSATTETFSITSMTWTSSPYVTLSVNQDSETITYTGYSSGGGGNIKFKTEAVSSAGSVVTVDNTTYTKYTFEKKCSFVATFSNGSMSATYTFLKHVDSSGTIKEVSQFNTSATNVNGYNVTLSGEAEVGDSVLVSSSGTPSDNATETIFSITATPIGSSTGIVDGADIDLSTYQYPQYDLTDFTVTGTNWTNVRTVLTPYKTSNEKYRVTGNIVGTTGTNVTSIGLAISGLVTKNTADFFQSVTVHGSGDGLKGRFTPNSGDVILFSSSSNGVWRASFDIELESWPTWATKENTFSGTINMPVAVQYETETKILSANATAAGDIAELTFTGLEVGAEYEVTGLVKQQNPSGTTQVVYFYSGAGGTGSLYHAIWSSNSNTQQITLNHGLPFKFTAASSTMYLNKNATGTTEGNGTRASTYIQLTRKTDTSGFVASSTDTVYKYANSLSPDEYQCGIVRSTGQAVYCQDLELNVAMSSSSVTTIATIASGLSIRQLNAMAVDSGNQWITLGSQIVAGTGYNFLRYDSDNGIISSIINGLSVTAKSVFIKYTKDSENP